MSDNSKIADNRIDENEKDDRQKSAPKVFQFIDGNTLMRRKYEPLKFAVEKILPHGIFIIAGAGKSAKSFWCLDLCVSIATGNKMWEFSCEHGDALYLALEDNYPRLQDRLNKIKAGDADISKLKLVTTSFGINSGLIEQTYNHLAKYPDTRIIVCDTLEKIRDTVYDENIYAYDYRDMTTLRKITNKYDLTLLLVHHTRKMGDKDPLNMLSGSMGLVGAVDGVFVLQKLTRTGDEAVLTIANRDTEDFCFLLRFDRENCKWSLLGNYEEESAEGKAKEKDERLATLVDELVKDVWCGTATELCDTLKVVDPNTDAIPITITKRLKGIADLLGKSGIAVELDRDRSNRTVKLIRRDTGGERMGIRTAPHITDTGA